MVKLDDKGWRGEKNSSLTNYIFDDRISSIGDRLVMVDMDGRLLGD